MSVDTVSALTCLYSYIYIYIYICLYINSQAQTYVDFIVYGNLRKQNQNHSTVKYFVVSSFSRVHVVRKQSPLQAQFLC